MQSHAQPAMTISADFGSDSSSCFLFRAQTDTQTGRQTYGCNWSPTHAIAAAGMDETTTTTTTTAAILWPFIQTTRVSQYLKKHSPTHTYHDLQSFFICRMVLGSWHCVNGMY